MTLGFDCAPFAVDGNSQPVNFDPDGVVLKGFRSTSVKGLVSVLA